MVLFKFLFACECALWWCRFLVGGHVVDGPRLQLQTNCFQQSRLHISFGSTIPCACSVCAGLAGESNSHSHVHFPQYRTNVAAHLGLTSHAAAPSSDYFSTYPCTHPSIVKFTAGLRCLDFSLQQGQVCINFVSQDGPDPPTLKIIVGFQAFVGFHFLKVACLRMQKVINNIWSSDFRPLLYVFLPCAYNTWMKVMPALCRLDNTLRALLLNKLT